MGPPGSMLLWAWSKVSVGESGGAGLRLDLQGCAGSVPGCCKGWGCRAEPCSLVPPYPPPWLLAWCDPTCVHHDCPQEEQPKEGLHFVNCSVPCPLAERAIIHGVMGTPRTVRSPLASLPGGS